MKDRTALKEENFRRNRNVSTDKILPCTGKAFCDWFFTWEFLSVKRVTTKARVMILCYSPPSARRD